MLWDAMRRDALGAMGDHPMREYLRIIDLLFVPHETGSSPDVLLRD